MMKMFIERAEEEEEVRILTEAFNRHKNEENKLDLQHFVRIVRELNESESIRGCRKLKGCLFVGQLRLQKKDWQTVF